MKTKEDAINILIKGCNTNDISDGYHTFGELYEHRIELFIALCKNVDGITVWKSRKHSDGTSFEGWFSLGIGLSKGEQITYHLPDKYWDELDFTHTLESAPEFDGHTSADVLKRLRKL
jgi:hypothetical protein